MEDSLESKVSSATEDRVKSQEYGSDSFGLLEAALLLLVFVGREAGMEVEGCWFDGGGGGTDT